MIESEISEKQWARSDKSTQVFTHEYLLQRMRCLTSSSKKLNRSHLQKQNLIAPLKDYKPTDYKSILYRNVLTRSHSDMMTNTELRLFNFLDNMVTDYPLLACNEFDKYRPISAHCSKKDLNGKIKVYTKKCIRFERVDEKMQKYIEKKEVATQTKPIPNYANPRNRKLFDKLYLEEDLIKI